MKIHKEGKRIIINSFIIIAIAVILFLTLSDSPAVQWIITLSGITLFFFICRFFRVPDRAPYIEYGAVVAPADGQIVIIKEVYEGEYLKQNAIQVSIFMSVFNVHINWFPTTGNIEYYKYHPGRYLVAFHPKSSEKNERTSVAVRSGERVILFRQIAGLLARRIVCYAKEGANAQQSSEYGFIKFGSRIDLFLPLDSKIEVKRGEKVTGSRTVIARLPE